MDSERCMSGSARGHAKRSVARPAQRACPTQPYVPLARGFVYLTAVIDVASRCVLAHRIATTLEACHAVEALEQAFARYGTPEIVNTDQGSQFTAEVFIDAVLARKSNMSMDGRGAGGTTSSLNGCGGQSNTRRST